MNFSKKALIITLYKIFLIILLLTQIYPLIFEDLNSFDAISHYILSVYLLFRLYIFVVLEDKADALNMSLTEFFNKRDEFLDKG